MAYFTHQNVDDSVVQVIAPVSCTCLCLHSASSCGLQTNLDALKSAEQKFLEITSHASVVSTALIYNDQSSVFPGLLKSRVSNHCTLLAMETCFCHPSPLPTPVCPAFSCIEPSSFNSLPLHCIALLYSVLCSKHLQTILKDTCLDQLDCQSRSTLVMYLKGAIY